MEALQLTFSRSDSIYEAFRAENNQLKTEVGQLKAKVKIFEDFLAKTEMDRKKKDPTASAMDNICAVMNEENIYEPN